MRNDPYRFGREQALGGYDPEEANMAIKADWALARWFRDFWAGYYDERRAKEMENRAAALRAEAEAFRERMGGRGTNEGVSKELDTAMVKAAALRRAGP